MLKNYRFGFYLWGFLLFIIIMIPNFVWFIFPAPDDILRLESTTKTLDTFASLCQVVMIIFLCSFINTKCKKISWTPLIVGMVLSCLCYYITWVLYYTGITNAAVVLSLCITPCLAFLFFSIDRKNMISAVFTILFMVLHLIYGFVNFLF